MRGVTFAALATIPLVCMACKSKGAWLHGDWLQITPDGKPAVCYRFEKKRKLTVYQGSSCEGAPDPILSGKWQMKENNRLAVLAGSESLAQLAIITEHTEDHFVSRGVLAGRFYRTSGDSATLLTKLSTQGIIKVKPLPGEWGCDQLGRALTKVKAMPAEKAARMLRQKDAGLAYYSTKGTAQIAKEIYAVNQDQLEWISLELAEAAYAGPGPSGTLEQILGAPHEMLTMDQEGEQQRTYMWKAYCTRLRGASNKEVDVTLFDTPSAKKGLVYVSAGVINQAWPDLKELAAEAAAAQSPTDDAKDEPEAKPAQ